MRTIERCFIFIFLYYIARVCIVGASTLPTEGDSLAYHIPIAQNLWQGGLFNPADILHYYPSIGEAILSFFLIFHIPLNLFNVVASVVLFFVCRLLGRQSGLKNEMATFFAVSICLLYITLRWINTQVIDIWLAVFFVWSLMLLQKPRKSISYFILLGTAIGLLIGTKNSGVGFAVILILVYWKNFIRNIDLKKFAYFATPVCMFGLFWYVRNYFLTGNPLYPQALLGMQGVEGWDILKWHVGQIAFLYPGKFINAMISEYMGWSLAIFSALFFRQKILILGLLNFFLFLFLPTTPEYSIIVSSFRYAYPAIIPCLLAVFLLAQKYKKESIVIAFSFINILFLFIHPYQPKLIFLFTPAILLYSKLVDHKYS